MSQTTTYEEGLLDEYINFHDTFKAQYNSSNFICLMMVGKFYECYSYENYGHDLDYIGEEILNMRTGQKQLPFKGKTIVAKMLGFPCEVINKYAEILIEHQYTVILIDQYKPDEEYIKAHKKSNRMMRKVSHIITPSTFIESNATTANTLMVAYIETNKNISSTKNNYSMGVAMINTITCAVEHIESHASYEPDNIIDEFNQIYHGYKPTELLIYEINNTKNEMNDMYVTKRLSITSNQVIFKYNEINKAFTKIPYQNNIFTEIYGASMLNAIETFDLSKYTYSIIALIIAFDYIYRHMPVLLKDLKQPILHNKFNHMVLFNYAQYQLEIVSYNNTSSIRDKHKPLSVLINNCCTAMGKRELIARLCAPYVSPTIINNIYKFTDNVIENNYYVNLRESMKKINDIERCFRKINIGSFTSNEVGKLNKSFNEIVNIFQFMIDAPTLKPELINYDFDNKNIKKLNTAILFIEDRYNVDNLQNDYINKTSECYYKKGIHANIDDIIDKIDNNRMINDLEIALSKLTGESFEIKNTRGNFYLQTTKAKGKNVEKLLKNSQTQSIVINDFLTVSTTDFNFEYLTANVKITHHIMQNYSSTISSMMEQLNKICKNHLLNEIIEWYNENKAICISLCKFITMLDYVCNNAYNSVKFHYVKPTIVEGVRGYINCQSVRHPIIERGETEYVANDFLIDETHCGNIIYGINSAGKSSFIKAVALNVILAQCGLFVASKSFEYSIVTKLFTRISSNDNIYEGESSFVVETKQIASIQRCADESSLIIADEMCKSTDYMSALCMVLTTSINLCKKKSPFLFASHLHEIPDIPKIKELTNIAFYHVLVEPGTDCIVFNRIINKGVLENNCGYGIMVAKYIMNNPDYIEQCVQFKTEILAMKGIHNNLIGTKQSRYCSNVFMDKCMSCGSKEKLETHHIIPQEDYRKNKNKKFHVAKNDTSNLSVLCSSCHDKIDTGEIIINGFVDTTNGRMIDIKTSNNK